MSKTTLVLFGLVQFLVAVSSQREALEGLFKADECGQHPRNALAFVATKKNDLYKKLCTVILVKQNIAIGECPQANLAAVSKTNQIYIMLAKNVQQVFKVVHYSQANLRDTDETSVEVFTFKNEAPLSHVCTKDADMRMASDLMTLNYDLKNVEAIRSQNYSIKSSDPLARKCRYEVAPSIVRASCDPSNLAAQYGVSYGFARVNNGWSMVVNNAAAKGASSKVEETFEMSGIDKAIEGLQEKSKLNVASDVERKDPKGEITFKCRLIGQLDAAKEVDLKCKMVF